MEPWIISFLRRQFVAAHDGGRCARLQLFHLAGRQRCLRTWSFAEAFEEDQIELLAAEIIDCAQQEAGVLGGSQRFSLCAYYAQYPEHVGESKAFARQGGGAEDGAEVDSEGPSEKGLLSQLMRHNEANARSVVQSSQQLLKAQAQMVDSLSARLAHMDDTHLKYVQTTESLLSERHIRDLATKEHELRAKAWSEGFDKLNLLAPVIVNKLAGQKILPEPTSVVNEMVGGFVESLSSEQLASLGGTLKPEQMIVVLNLVEERRRQIAQNAAETAAHQRVLAGPGGSSNGSASPGAASASATIDVAGKVPAP